MQTYTHLPIGVVAGALLFPHDAVSQAACIAGNVAPDGYIAWKFLCDKLKGQIPFGHITKREWLLIEITTSLVVYLVLAATTFFFSQVAFIFFLGCIVHTVIDILTHNGVEYHRSNPTYAWPFAIYLSEKFGVYDYRIASGLLWPLKKFELAVLVISSILAFCLLVLR